VAGRANDAFAPRLGTPNLSIAVSANVLRPTSYGTGTCGVRPVGGRRPPAAIPRPPTHLDRQARRRIPDGSAVSGAGPRDHPDHVIFPRGGRRYDCGPQTAGSAHSGTALTTATRALKFRLLACITETADHVHHAAITSSVVCVPNVRLPPRTRRPTHARSAETRTLDLVWG